MYLKTKFCFFNFQFRYHWELIFQSMCKFAEETAKGRSFWLKYENPQQKLCILKSFPITKCLCLRVEFPSRKYTRSYAGILVYGRIPWWPFSEASLWKKERGKLGEIVLQPLIFKYIPSINIRCDGEIQMAPIKYAKREGVNWNFTHEIETTPSSLSSPELYWKRGTLGTIAEWWLEWTMVNWFLHMRWITTSDCATKREKSWHMNTLSAAINKRAP